MTLSSAATRNAFSLTAQRMLRAFGGQMLWMAFNQGSTFATNIVAGNILGANAFGKYSILYGTIQSVSGLASLGMGYTATKFISEYRTVNKLRAGELFGFTLIAAIAGGLAGCLFVVFSAPSLAKSLLRHSDLTRLLTYGAPAILFNSINLCLVGCMCAFEAFGVLGKLGVGTGLLYLAVMTAGLLGDGVQGALLALTVAAGMQTLVLVRTLQRVANSAGIRPRFRRLTDEWTIIRSWVVPGLLSGLTAIPALWLAQAFLTRQVGGYRELGMYTSAFYMMNLVLFLPTIANAITMPFINNALGERDDQRYRHVFWINAFASVGLVIVGGLGIGLFGGKVLGIFGREFTGGGPILLLLLGAALPESLTVALNQVLQSKGRAWLCVVAINLPRDSTIVAAAYFLVPKSGAIGLAESYLIGRILGVLLTALVVWIVGMAVESVETAGSCLRSSPPVVTGESTGA